MAVEQQVRSVSELDDAVVQRFVGHLHGGALRPGAEGYDAARSVWNGMIDKRPGLIARCADNDDVIAAVNFAREQSLLVAVRGGGHNAAGFGVCDEGLVIDLSAMNDVQVDPAQRLARAQGGATWGGYDQATQAHGLASTGGAISTTGIAGLTLGGGLGWLMRSYGLACDNLRSVQIVTADGQLRTASASENADLFWGVRGGGGNFGVVTSFEYQLHPVSMVLGGMLIHPMQRAREVLRFYRDFTAAAPDEVIVFAAMMTSPDGVPIIALVPLYNGPLDAGEAALRPLREFGPPIVDQVGPMPYLAVQSMLDGGFPAGQQVYWRSSFLKNLDDDAIDTLLERVAAVTSPLSVALIEQFGGAVSRVGRDETAFDHRDSLYNLAIVGRWIDPAEADPHIAWTRDSLDAMNPYARGVYVNYLGEEGDARIRSAYGDAKYQRLLALKNTYDPTNLFRLNQNIRPTA